MLSNSISHAVIRKSYQLLVPGNQTGTPHYWQHTVQYYRHTAYVRVIKNDIVVTLFTRRTIDAPRPKWFEAIQNANQLLLYYRRGSCSCGPSSTRGTSRYQVLVPGSNHFNNRNSMSRLPGTTSVYGKGYTHPICCTPCIIRFQTDYHRRTVEMTGRTAKKGLMAQLLFKKRGWTLVEHVGTFHTRVSSDSILMLKKYIENTSQHIW